MSFDYDVFTTRNLGFVSPAEQARLRAGGVFVAGVGGMGGACLASLARAGVGRLAIADIDHFEVSNLNRQVFANLDTLGQAKAAASAAAVRRINPQVELEVFGGEWTTRLADIAARYPVIVNGCDDVAATVQLYRVARAAGASVIDAYASPLPSVTLVRPQAPRPEDRLRYPTRGQGVGDQAHRGGDARRLPQGIGICPDPLLGRLSRRPGRGGGDGGRKALADVLRPDGHHHGQSHGL